MLAGGDSAAALLLSSYRLQHFATQLLSACLPAPVHADTIRSSWAVTHRSDQFTCSSS